MRAWLARLTRERRVLLGVLALAVGGCLMGLVVPPRSDGRPDGGRQALDLLRVLTTMALAASLVLGPGLAWRTRRGARDTGLGLLVLPGLALLVTLGVLVWTVGGTIGPRVLCAVVVLPVLGWLVATAAATHAPDVLTREERGALLLVGAALAVAVARGVWSLGPAGEVGEATNRRTLEVGDRPDSAIPFDVLRLVANGVSPFSAEGRGLILPWRFSDRGPLSGVAAAPLALLSGGRPPRGHGGVPWVLFDAEGFMAYRIAMMAFASTAFVALWTLVRRVADARTARFALLLAVTTPFLVHEVWFTWPKLLASCLVLLSAVLVLDRRPLAAGALAGAAYLVHPLALLSVPVLLLLALSPPGGGRLRSPSVRPALAALAGIGAAYAGWRLVNGSHYSQGAFFDYLTEAGRPRYLEDLARRVQGVPVAAATPWDWLSSRFVSVTNTLVPLRLFLFSRHDPSINMIDPACFPFCLRETSPPVIPFFQQYWTTLPFGLGIAFFPLLLVSLWRALRRWPWTIAACVLLPFAGFAVYWGDAVTGMLREGLHVWVLTLLAVVAIEQGRERFPWLRSAPLRALLALRAMEVLALAMVPTLVTRHRVVSAHFALTDVIAVVTMVSVCCWLGAQVWRARADNAPEPRPSAP